MKQLNGTPAAYSQYPRSRAVLNFVLVLFIISICYTSFNFYGLPHPDLIDNDHALHPTNLRAPRPHVEKKPTMTLVLGRLSEESNTTSWTADLDPDIAVIQYIVDDPTAPYSLRENAGREAMVYLTYIEQHYDNLSDVALFTHSSRDAWHNNVLLRSNLVPTANRLRRDHVEAAGYFNTRCELYPGCPTWITFNPNDTVVEEDHARAVAWFTDALWAELFPGRASPRQLAEPCCSQFAVSRETVQAVPLATYTHIRRWMEGGLDQLTGRILEYVWQYLFTGKEVVCPTSMAECYCDAYDVCFGDEGEEQLTEYIQVREKEDLAWVGPNGTRWDVMEEAVARRNRLEESLPKEFGIDSPFALDG